jgi:hypothetical protein
MYQSAPWRTPIFFNPQCGDVQTIPKPLTFCSGHLKCTDVISTRSEVWFIKQIQCSGLLVKGKRKDIPVTGRGGP